jgi:hypothetical protein
VDRADRRRGENSLREVHRKNNGSYPGGGFCHLALAQAWLLLGGVGHKLKFARALAQRFELSFGCFDL